MSQQVQMQQSRSLPATIVTLAATHQIGTPVAEYKYGSVGTLIGSILLVLLGVLLMLFILVGFSGVSIGFFIIGLLSVIYAIKRFMDVRRYRGNGIYLCTDGLMSVAGARVEAVRWEQGVEMWKPFRVPAWAIILNIMNILNGEWWRSSRAGNSYQWGTGYSRIYVLDKYVLRRADGREVVIDKGFRKFKKLGKAIEQVVTNRLMPNIIARYNAGQSISFGEITLNQQGIMMKNGTIAAAWPEVRSVTAVSGTLSIYWKKQGKMLPSSERIAVAKIPNVCVLVAFAKNIIAYQKQQKA